MKWIKEEVALLKTVYGKLPYSELKKLFGRSRYSIKGKAIKLGLKGDRSYVISLTSKKYNVNKGFFKHPNIINSYVAGFIAADGSVHPERNTVKISLSRVDREHLVSIAKEVGFDGPVFNRVHNGFKENSEKATLCISGVPEWINDLEHNFSIVPRKSLILQPPENLDYLCSLAYIVGYCDGDGSISFSSEIIGKMSISFVGTRAVLSWIKCIFDKVRPSKRTTACVLECRSKRVFSYRVNSTRADDLAKELLLFEVPRLRRKWEKVVNKLELDYTCYSS